MSRVVVTKSRETLAVSFQGAITASGWTVSDFSDQDKQKRDNRVNTRPEAGGIFTGDWIVGEIGVGFNV